MRTILKLAALSAALAATLAGSGAQAQSVDLKVSAEIVPASCNISLGNGGLFDYGRIAASTLNQTGYTKLPVRSTTLSVTCDAPAKVAIGVIDNRNGSQLADLPINQPEMGPYPTLTQYTSFGLGTASGVKLGGYGITLDNASHMANGTQAGILAPTCSVAESWIPEGRNSPMRKDACFNQRSWGNGINSFISATTFSAQLNIQPVLNRGDALPLTGAISVDGHATIALIYL